MAYSPLYPDTPRQQDWAWRVGFVLENYGLITELSSAIRETGAIVVFEFQPSDSSFEVANAVDRDHPDVLFVELARTAKNGAEWMVDVHRGEDTPLVVAVHPHAEPAEMIAALRAGASEFLSLPVRPAIYEAMERIGTLLEARSSALVERGRIAGVLSAKGGCGATSIACHLGAALQLASAKRPRVLVADLDCQSPGAREIFRINPAAHAGEAFDAVRRMTSSSWREFATPIAPGVDLLAAPADVSCGSILTPPEPWRVESLFRFVSRQYNWVLADLGRHLNPVNWTLLQNIDELFVITAPDVLTLYQTRSVLQTLSSRGFEKSRIKMILNRNLSSPNDFWVESIEQMFEMTVFGVIPNDDPTMERLPRDRYEFPVDTPFGKALTKIAARLAKPGGPGGLKRAA